MNMHKIMHGMNNIKKPCILFLPHFLAPSSFFFSRMFFTCLYLCYFPLNLYQQHREGPSLEQL
jgi:hypothetical protein